MFEKIKDLILMQFLNQPTHSLKIFKIALPLIFCNENLYAFFLYPAV